MTAMNSTITSELLGQLLADYTKPEGLTGFKRPKKALMGGRLGRNSCSVAIPDALKFRKMGGEHLRASLVAPIASAIRNDWRCLTSSRTA